MNLYHETLELHKILEALSNEASNGMTKEMALSLEPSSDLRTVKDRLSKTAEAFDLSVKYGSPSFRNFKDIRQSLKRARAGSSLSLRELLDAAQMLGQIRALDDWRKACNEREPEVLSYLFSALSPNRYLEDKIKNAIISEDEISDAASPALAGIRRKTAAAGLKVRQTLDRLIRSETVKKALQENIVTMRDGRYVIPVKAEHKGAVRGLIHATSSSGSTYFIEPEAVVEANNEIKILEGMEQEEIERIIAELSAECGTFSENISEDFLICAELNLYFSQASLAAKMNAGVPAVSDDGVTELIKARHPLIDKKKVVPVDIRLGGDYQALIVTGPNTGGKTVLLKTTGLLTLMVMCGMMIPASDGSRVSVFDNILADIGDMQSIEESLSTFSSHIINVVKIMEKADGRSLILLDELGSGTDPVEGAALAVSMIENLISKGSRLLVTTHYQELKLYAIEKDGIENASCEFDSATLAPTYRLITGTPGKSNAFSISARLGVPESVINAAKDMVSKENRRFEAVVEQLELSRNELEAQNAEIRRLKDEHAEKLESLEAEIEAFNERRGNELEKARVQATRIIESCRMQTEELIDELSKLKKQKDSENFSQLASGLKSRTKAAFDKMYDEANPVRKNEKSSYKLPRALKKGDSVLIADINRTGVLESDPDGAGNVTVRAGVMKTKINIINLRLIEAEKKSSAGGKVSTRQVRGAMERSASVELDIRGHAVDEGIYEMDMFIDNAVLTGAGIVTVIHGKGTGVLRDGIRRRLKSHPSVKSFRPGSYGEGEDGVTVVHLR